MRCHFIGMDAHGQFCELAVVNESGDLIGRGRCDTSIPKIVTLLKPIAKPRKLVIEEGPMADWLWRNLRLHVEEMVVCEPRRNRLISDGGDKDDPVDAEKLAQLLRGGFVKVVHHPEALERSVLKQHVSLYHDRVRHRVSEAHRVRCLFKRHGAVIKERDFVKADDRPALLARLPDNGTLREDIGWLWKSYDVATEHEELFRRRLVGLAKQEEVMRRWEELPGIGWVRAATLFVWLDTPWRFASKQALWKYLGIGLERSRSGNGPERLHVPRQVNRVLKSTILGAAKSAVAQSKNPFADQHRRWLEQGLSLKLARRNVARSLSATMWGLWKNGSVYRPEWVGVAAAAMVTAEVSR